MFLAFALTSLLVNAWHVVFLDEIAASRVLLNRKVIGNCWVRIRRLQILVVNVNPPSPGSLPHLTYVRPYGVIRHSKFQGHRCYFSLSVCNEAWWLLDMPFHCTLV